MFRYNCFGTASLALSLVTLTACERSESHPPREQQPAPASPASVAEAVGVDAAGLSAPVDPAPPAGDLAAELAHFSTLDACVKERAALDPLVGDALRSIGYETFLRDACRLLEATKSKSAAKCAPIDASTLRERCEAYVAMAGASPDTCPWSVASEPALGREPSCVAIAAHDPRLCAAVAERGSRATCEAIAAHDETRCGGTSEALRAECKREAARWHAVIEAPPKVEEPPAARGHIELRGANGSPDPVTVAQDWAADLGRGVVLDLAGDGDHLTIGSARDTGAALGVTGPTASTRLALTCTVTHDAPADARLDRLELDVPGDITVVCPGARCDLRVGVKKLERARAGLLELVVDGTAGTPPHALKVHAEAVTFVRDVVKEGIRAFDAGPIRPR